MDNTSFGITIGLVTKGFAALSGDVKKLEKLSTSLKDAGKNVTALNKKIEKIGGLKAHIDSNLGKISGEFSNLQTRLATAASFAIPVKFAIDDEAAFANVRKYVDDSEENLQKLKQEMKGLSNELGESFENLADIASGGGKINLAGEELVKYTRLLSTGAVAFEMSADDVARASNNMKVGFKIDKIDDLKKFFDVVNLLDNKVTNANASDILTATSLTAGNANLLGLNEKAASAIAASMLSTGKAPSVVGTSLNSLYTKLANVENQGKKFQEALSTIGLDATYLKTAIGKDAAGAVTLFLDSIAKAPKQMQAGLLYDLMGGNFSDEIAGLITNMDAFKANMKLAFSDEANGSMQKELQTKLNTTKSSLERLAQAWRNIGSSIGEAFLPSLGVITAFLNKVAGGISYFMKEFPVASKIVFGFLGGFLAFVTVAPMLKMLWWSMGIVISQIKIMATAFSFLASVFKTKALLALRLKAAYLWVAASTKTAAFFTAAWNMVCKAFALTLSGVSKALKILVLGVRAMSLALISNPIGLILTLLAAAAAAIIMNWDKVKAFFSDFWEAIKPYWEATANFFTSIFDSVVAWWNELFGGFFDWIGEKFAWISDITSTVGDALGNAWKGTKEFFGFGDDEESKQESKSSDVFERAFGKDSAAPTRAPMQNIARQPAMVTQTTSGSNITINLNGGFNIATSEGRFDLSEFERALTQSVKRAIQRDNFNQANTEIRE